ncbi:sigma-54-dependent Fis family transcriptional regulator, partial [candidate division TA06 bacterium]|nr:sigma-54-dependent Fis family transcriptional regulator [candidate division TA06 bacterium]
MKTILVVDDEPNMRRVLSAVLEKEGFHVLTAGDGEEALRLFVGAGLKTTPTAVITDLKMPKMDGLQLLIEIHRRDARIPVVMITAHGTIETAVEAMKRGAYDYITKPFDTEEIKMIVKKALAVQEASSKDVGVQNFEPLLELGPEVDSKIIGKSRRMKQVYETVHKVSQSVATVLILGESGTGKELIARAIHSNSPRREKPFIRVSCAALPESLLESELFGYEKGAFTGAATRKPGRFELAHQGSLFLDEIGELSTATQSKLLRVLQEREFERLGGVETIKVDVRIIAATSKDLEKALGEGSFREDLYYRLNVVSVDLPPLRERKEDIPDLANYFLERFCKREGKEVKLLNEEALSLLLQYEWPGNIRELENVIEKIVVLQEEKVILPQHLPETLNRPPHSDPELVSGRTQNL